MLRLIIASVVIIVLVSWFMVNSIDRQEDRTTMEKNIEQVELSMDSSGN